VRDQRKGLGCSSVRTPFDKANQFFWAFDGQVSHEQRVHQAEDGSRPAHAQHQRQDGCGRQHGSSTQQPACVSNVLTDAFDPDPSPGGARVLLDETTIAKVSMSSEPCFVLGHATRRCFFPLVLQMEIEFRPQFGFPLSPLNHPPEFGEQRSHKDSDSAGSARMHLVIMVAHAARRKVSRRLNHSRIWFQLADVRLTNPQFVSSSPQELSEAAPPFGVANSSIPSAHQSSLA
jgi:hypothetical protein